MLKRTDHPPVLIISLLCIIVLSACASSEYVQEDSPLQNPQPDKAIITRTAPLQINDHEKYRFDHFGIVVSDIEKSVAFYTETFGMKFEAVHEYQLEKVSVRGRPQSYSMKCAFAILASTKMELIEISDGESLHTEFLKAKGQGIQHLSYYVKDLEKEISHARELDLELITYFETADVPVMAYFETENGMVLELVQENVKEMIEKAQRQSKE